MFYKYPNVVIQHSRGANAKALKGLLELCQKKDISHGYVVTKSLDDFGVMKNLPDIKTKLCIYPRHYIINKWVHYSVLLDGGSN